MTKKRKKFNDYSKPMQILMLLGAGFWAIVFMAIANAPETPKKELTPYEIERSDAFNMCRLMVIDSMVVKGSAEIPITSLPQYDFDTSIWSHTVNFQAKNAFGVKISQTYTCKIKSHNEEFTPIYLKIGNNVLLNSK